MDKGFVIRAAGLPDGDQGSFPGIGICQRLGIAQNFFGRSFVTDAFNAAFSIKDFI